MKMILDLDTGIDDTLALACVLGTPQIDLIGVVCSYGNVEVDQAVKNTLKVLSLFGREDIPVIRGAQAPLEKDVFEVRPLSRVVHGVDGIGDTGLPDVDRSAAGGTAEDFFYDMAVAYGPDLVIVTEGPLTNLAAAIRKYPDLEKTGVRVVTMGGAVCVEGNMTPVGESNLFQDPLSDNIVFSGNLPVTLVPLDVTLRTLLSREYTADWRERKHPAGKFLADMTDYYIAFHEKVHPQLHGCALHDPLAALIPVFPEIVTTIPCALKVLTEGYNKDRCVMDLEAMAEGRRNIALCLDVKEKPFVESFNKAILSMINE